MSFRCGWIGLGRCINVNNDGGGYVGVVCAGWFAVLVPLFFCKGG